MDHRLATLDDVNLLADMNRLLVEDEQHRNRFRDVAWFRNRMRGFLAGEYKAVIFEEKGFPVAYALFRLDGEEAVYLRQIFVARHRRGRGVGRAALDILRKEYWPPDRRVTVDALVTNPAAIAFYHALGFQDYALQMELPRVQPGPPQ